MKICLITEFYLPHLGGIEIVVKELSERLVKKGHEIHIITMYIPGTFLCEKTNGVFIHRVKVPQILGRYWFNSFFSIPLIFRIGKKCDIIHSCSYNCAFPPWIVSLLLRKKTVLTVHEPLGNNWQAVSSGFFSAKFHQIIERILLALPFDYTICVSEYAKKTLNTMNQKKEKSIEVIYNGIDNDLFDPTRYDPHIIREKLGLCNNFVYLYYGRPGITKGIDDLIDAVPKISERIPNSKLLLILAKDPWARYAHIVQQIKKLKIEDRIILIDPVPREQLPYFIAAADCVVVPSRSEGFGFTAVESCIMNKPVLITNAGSLPEVVSGTYVISEPNNPDSLSEGIIKNFNKDFSTSPRKQFDWDSSIEKYERIYHKLIKV